jgi:hypothetical protein
MIDYRAELKDAKRKATIYLQTDSHWNQYGAYIAYKKIMERISKDFPGLKPEPMRDFNIDSSCEIGGDLQSHWGFNDVLKSEYYYFKLKSGKMPVALDSADLSSAEHIEYNIREMPDKKDALTLFVIRDSFSDALRVFLSNRFKRSVYAWTKYPPVQTILKEKPAIILHEVLERFLDATLVLPDEIKNDTAFLKKNFPHYQVFNHS